LRNRTTKLLGLVVSSVANPIFAGTVAAIEERAHELGYDLLLTHTLNMPDREEACIRRLLSRRVDGLFIFPVYRLAPAAAITRTWRGGASRRSSWGTALPFAPISTTSKPTMCAEARS